jgi:uncharacterized membrane protein YvlD (DUF360 family)
VQRVDAHARRLLLVKLTIRGLVTWGIEAVALAVLVRLLPGVFVADWKSGLLVVLVIGALNALVRPAIMMLSVNLGLARFLLTAFVLNGLIVLVAAAIVPGFAVDGFWTAFLLAFGLAILNTLISGLLGINDDDSFYRNVVRWLQRRRVPTSDLNEPGTILIQIDGLAEPIIRRELEAGGLPTLARWLASGSHQLVGWECDLPSMTTSGQTGILYGNNANIPAFRWYEKSSGRLMVSNHPNDAHLIDQRQSTDHGLLREEGSSVANIVAGGAEHCVVTMSHLTSESGQVTVRSRDLYDYFVNPYNLYRALGAMFWDVLLERRQARRQRLDDVQPRMERDRSYRLARSITVVLLRDITTWTIVADMFAGRRVVYADYLGYDEVAHHAGPATEDARSVLRKMEGQLQQLESAARRAPRQYRFVVLSDHGQSTGATFHQRFGQTLDELVRSLLPETDVRLAAGSGEGPGQVDALVSEVTPLGGAVGGAGRWIVQHLGIGRPEALDPAARDRPPVNDANVVVCASGNLALVYFTQYSERLSQEAINRVYPGLLEELVRHPGIGFLLVESEVAGGPVVLGPKGQRNLQDDSVTGEDPLAGLSLSTSRFLRRLSTYTDVGDLVVNSLWEPETGQVAAFEELIGCHGGAGGAQTAPFLLYPSEWGPLSEPIVGAEQLHAFLSKHV